MRQARSLQFEVCSLLWMIARSVRHTMGARTMITIRHSLKLLMGLPLAALSFQDRDVEIRKTPICQLLANPLKFEGQTVAVEGRILQYAWLLHLMEFPSTCAKELEGKPEAERVLSVWLPHGVQLDDSDEATKQLVKLINETAKHQTRRLYVSASIVGIVRKAPKSDRTLHQSSAPFAIEVLEARENQE